MTKTPVTKPAIIKRHWHLVDLNNQILGRVVTQISQLLIGKSKPYYTANLDCGDYVVAINAQKIATTGKKLDQKLYRWHTGYPGGFREKNFKQMIKKDPRQVIIHAVKGMLPKNKLRSQRLKRLKVFPLDKHPHTNKFSQNKQ